MFDLIVVGNIGIDVNTFPKRNNGRDVTITQMGGAVIYSAVPASMVSDKVGIVTTAGSDYDQSIWEHRGISTLGLKRNSDKSHRFFNTYLSEDGQQREETAQMNPEGRYDITAFPKEYLNAKYIHLATDHPQHQIKAIKYLRGRTNAKISIDTIERLWEWIPEEVIEAFSLADINFTDKSMERLLRESTASTKIVKRGKEGLTYKTKDTEISVAAPKVDFVVDKTGAGDCVTGIFLSLLAQTNNIRFSLKKACEVASASITKYGIHDIPYDFEKLKAETARLTKNQSDKSDLL